jgi:hypothetical protein
MGFFYWTCFCKFPFQKIKVMKFKRTLIVPAALVFAAALCSLALPPGDEKPKNLKVLPKDITHEELMKTMHDYNRALGVHCDFCHAHSKADPSKMDFASDEKEEKETARDMYKMMMKINKKYFKAGKDEKGNVMLSVGCYTCHNGHKEPVEAPAGPDMKGGPQGAPGQGTPPPPPPPAPGQSQGPQH